MRLLRFVLGCFGVVVGVVALLSPIPIGVVILSVSLVLLLSSSPKVCSVMLSLREKYSWLNRKVHQLEHHLEDRLPKFAAIFHQTRPDKSPLQGESLTVPEETDN